MQKKKSLDGTSVCTVQATFFDWQKTVLFGFESYLGPASSKRSKTTWYIGMYDSKMKRTSEVTRVLRCTSGCAIVPRICKSRAKKKGVSIGIVVYFCGPEWQQIPKQVKKHVPRYRSTSGGRTKNGQKTKLPLGAKLKKIYYLPRYYPESCFFRRKNRSSAPPDFSSKIIFYLLRYYPEIDFLSCTS